MGREGGGEGWKEREEGGEGVEGEGRGDIKPVQCCREDTTATCCCMVSGGTKRDAALKYETRSGDIAESLFSR